MLNLKQIEDRDSVFSGVSEADDADADTQNNKNSQSSLGEVYLNSVNSQENQDE